MDTDRQRHPSVSTNRVNANADPRLLRGSKGNASVQSPISTDGGAYQDAASNRTTPQPQTAVMTTVGGIVGTNNDGDAFKKQLLESLKALTTHITADVSLQSSQDLANRQLESATAEHESMQGHFRKYPAIEERTRNDREKAAKKVTQLEKQRQLSESSQSKAVAPLCETIWDLFSKAAAASRPEPQRDAVTREEFEVLQDRFQKQQDLLDQHQDRIEKQLTTIEELRKAAKEAGETSVRAKTVSGDIAALNTRIGKVESSDQTDKRILNDLVGVVARQQDDMGRLTSGNLQNKSELAAVKEDTLTLKSATSSASENVGKVERQLVAVRNEVDQISKDIIEPGKAPVLGRLENHDQILNNLYNKITSNESSQKALEGRVEPAEASLTSILQDLSKVKENANEPARIKLAEERIESLAREISDIKADDKLKKPNDTAAIVVAPAATPVPAAPLNNFDPVAFKQEVVEDIEEQTAKLAELLDDHDGHIEKLQEGLDALGNKLDKMELEHDNEARKRLSLDQANRDSHDSTTAKCEAIQSDVTGFKTTTDTLRTEFNSLSATVRSLQDRPSQPSAHMNGTVAAQQFAPLSVHSPRALTPRTSMSGPVQTNGVHPPNGALPPQQLANGMQAGPSNGDVAVPPDQIQGIWTSIRSLQQRYDNLTTEEIVRAMVDQQSKMYPAPKEFQAAVNTLQKVDMAFDAKLMSFETRLSSLEARVGSLAQNSAVNILRNEFKNTAKENNVHTNVRIQQLQNDIAAVRDTFKQLRNDTSQAITSAQKSFDHAVGLQTDAITDMQAKVRALAEKAFDDMEDE